MERKIGETFEYEGEKLKVVNAGTACDGCYFKGKSCDNRNYDITGICGWTRKDNQPVRFIKVTEEQQAEQPQKLNLCEILKDCPKGTKFYSYIFGDETYFQGFSLYEGKPISIIIYGKKGEWQNFSLSRKGHPYSDECGECCIFPSREMRDWSKFTAPWLKKERFDPKTLKPFDKVLVNHDDIWKVDFFSHICQYEPNGWCQCTGDSYYICIPYNDDTKHLVGTKDEAPDFYKYWED